MRNIKLLCAGGMSTSILVSKMIEVAKKEGYACEIDAFAVDTIKTSTKNADCVLLAPQVAYRLEELQELVNCPMGDIDMVTYGMMNGAAALNLAKELMGD